MTYDKAQIIYKKRYGRTVKICWIADIKRKHGKTKHQSGNRMGINPKYPCPDYIFPKLERVLKELNMIGLAPAYLYSQLKSQKLIKTTVNFPV